MTMRGSDLAEALALTSLGEGRYQAELSRDWEIWGPMGGYIASFALCAAGAESRFDRPVSFFCQYLGVAGFDAPIDLEVTQLRSSRNVESYRVHLTQGDRAILEATVWAMGEVEGLEHDVAVPPEVEGPDGLPTVEERFAARGEEPQTHFKFWENFVTRPVDWHDEWPPKEPLPPTYREWHRFSPTPTFTDPWVDAARSVILLDVASWPSAHRLHAWKWPNGQEWIAPTLDLYVAFHEPHPDEEWLLIDGHSPFGRDGLVAWNARLWSPGRNLIATAAGQLLCRRVPPQT